MHSLMEALAQRASGRLTDADLAKVAALHNELESGFEKRAAPSSGAAGAIGKRLLEAFGRGIEHSVPLIVAGLGVTGAAAGGRMLADKATKGSDLNHILEVYPHLKDYPRSEIELAYSSMRHMNPHIAKDPLAGGTLLGQMLRSRDPLNPKVLRFEPQLAGDLLRLNPREEHAFEEVARDAVMKGVGSAMEDLSRERSTRGQQAFMREQEEGRRAFDQQREEARARDAAEDRAHRDRMAERERWARTRSEAVSRKHQLGLERHKANLRDRSEAGRRAWDTKQKSDDRAHQLKNTVLQGMLNKSEPDTSAMLDPYGQPVLDPATGLPFQTAAPTISSVLQQHYPHLRP